MNQKSQNLATSRQYKVIPNRKNLFPQKFHVTGNAMISIPTKIEIISI